MYSKSQLQDYSALQRNRKHELADLVHGESWDLVEHVRGSKCCSCVDLRRGYVDDHMNVELDKLRSGDDRSRYMSVLYAFGVHVT